MQHGHMPFLCPICFVRPGISSMRPGVSVQVEDFYYSIPNRLALKHLFYGDALNVRSLRSVEFVDDVSEFVYVAHDTASTRSPTLQN